VVIENQPGAGGVIGAEMGARAAPDGYTVLVGSSAIVINPSLYRKVGYDPERDFRAVTKLAWASLVLVVHPSLPVRSVRELVALGRARPGQITYASGGSGSAAHLGGELFKSMAGIDLLHVPYRGTAPALTDLIGGHVTVAFYTWSAIGTHVRGGRLRALAQTGLTRSPAMAELPTVHESGVPNYESGTWIGVLVPAATPNEIVETLHRHIAAILQQPDVRERFASQGFDIIGNSPTEFAAAIRADIPHWARVVRAANARVD
jgi:tripartite-type tricarboxylate transporter receptor subunit TctC